MEEKVKCEVAARSGLKRQEPLNVTSEELLLAGELLEQVEELDESKKAELRDMVKKLLDGSMSAWR